MVCTMERAPSIVLLIIFSQYTCETGLQAGVGHRRMPEVRRRNDNRLQILFFGEQVLIILVSADFVAELLQVALALAAVVLPDVAQGHQPDALNVQERLEQNLALPRHIR